MSRSTRSGALWNRRTAAGAIAGLIVLSALIAGGFRIWQMHEDAAAADEAVAATLSFDPAKPGSFDRLNGAVAKRPGVVRALGPYLRDQSRSRRFAAIYLSGLVAQGDQDAQVLSVALDDPDQSFRIMAAGSLAGLGQVRSIPVLIEGLASTASLPYGDPPRPVADLAREALGAYTGQRFADLQGWRGWWSSVQQKLHWNGSAYVS